MPELRARLRPAAGLRLVLLSSAALALSCTPAIAGVGSRLGVGLAQSSPLGVAPSQSSPIGGGQPSAVGEIFFDDFELGTLDRWSQVQRVARNRIRVVAGQGVAGSHAARFEVRPGDHWLGERDSRAELAYTGQMASEGDLRTYSWSTMFAPGFPSSPLWQDFFQWKNEGTGTPPLQMAVERERIILRAGPQAAFRELWSAPLTRGRWLSFSVRVQWSALAAIGWVELAYNGRQVLPRAPLATLYPGLRNYFKIGMYRAAKSVGTAVVFADNVHVAG